MDLMPGLPGTALDPAAYAVSGCVPRGAVRPASRDELAELLRAASREGLTMLPWGGGTAAAFDNAPERYDLAIDLSALNAIVEYDPEDLTITAECGVTLETLRKAIAARGQELPIEGGHATRATLGGALAANASGPRRLRFGAPRDRLLGARFALSDGTLARTGGKVVKNVSGHAVHRLLCGSRGALAVILEASLKLLPAPALRRALIFPAEAAQLRDVARWTQLPRLEPSALSVVSRGVAAAIDGLPTEAPFTIIVVLEDNAAWVERQTELIESALGAAGQRLEGEAVVTLTQALCDAPERWSRRLSLTTAWNSPAALGVIDLDAASSELVFHTLAGRLHLEPGNGLPTTEVRRLAGQCFSLIDCRGVEPLASSPSAAAVGILRHRISVALDPAHLWVRGQSWESGG